MLNFSHVFMPAPNLTCKLIAETLQARTVGVKGGVLHNDKVKSQKVVQTHIKICLIHTRAGDSIGNGIC